MEKAISDKSSYKYRGCKNLQHFTEEIKVLKYK